MSEDDRATVTALDAARTVFQIGIESNHGRVVDMTGDSVLAIFDAATGAVEAALAIQAEVNAAAEAVPEGRRMRFRIGVHLGDLIQKVDGAVYGDGVNIAARLEGLAAPGGITVSDAIRGAVRSKVDATFDDQGEQRVKNIPYPVRAYRVCAAQTKEDSRSDPRYTPSLTLGRKQTIRVIPFGAVEETPALKAFAQGLTEDVITQLSRISSLSVVSSEAAPKGHQSVESEQGGLASGKVLQCFVRQASGRIRVTVKLLDAANGSQIWGDKLDSPFADSFEAQDDITRSIVASVQTQVQLHSGASLQAASTGLTAGQLVAQAQQKIFGLNTKAFHHAKDLATKALDLDPDNPAALRIISTAWFHLAYDGAIPWTEGADNAMLFARRAVESDVEIEYGQWALATAHLLRKEHARAMASLRRALEINPNFSLGYGTLGTVLAWAGNIDDSISNNLIAMKADPGNPSMFFRHFGLALAHYLAGRYPTSRDFAARVVQARPTWWLGLVIYGAGLAQCGQVREAEGVCAELRQQVGEHDIWVSDMPFANPSDCEHLMQGLRKAGMKV
jgi:adenylate cyclase